jgi:type IV pilus assembly protein PilZ
MDSGEASASNRRQHDRIDVSWDVDCETEDTFLYASIRNVSELGIFVLTREPLEVGTSLMLRFSPPGAGEALDPEGFNLEGFNLEGRVQWVNPVRVLSDNRNPGMGILFVNITAEERERLVSMVRTIAYVRDPSN